MEEYRRSGNILLLFTITTRASFVINNIVKSLVLNKLDPVCENFSRSSGSPYINIFQSFRCRVLQLYLAKKNQPLPQSSHLKAVWPLVNFHIPVIL